MGRLDVGGEGEGIVTGDRWVSGISSRVDGGDASS